MVEGSAPVAPAGDLPAGAAGLVDAWSSPDMGCDLREARGPERETVRARRARGATACRAPERPADPRRRPSLMAGCGSVCPLARGNAGSRSVKVLPLPGAEVTLISP